MSEVCALLSLGGHGFGAGEGPGQQSTENSPQCFSKALQGPHSAPADGASSEPILSPGTFQPKPGGSGVTPGWVGDEETGNPSRG